jgi:hypothetical protein
LKRLHGIKHPRSTLGEGSLLKPLNEIIQPQSRSLTPQRVFRCGPKPVKKTQPSLGGDSKLLETRNDGLTMRMNRKTLVFSKSPGSTKRKESTPLTEFAVLRKLKPKSTLESSDKKTKRPLKTKKKKKMSILKPETYHKDENSKQKASEYSTDCRVSVKRPQLVKSSIRSDPLDRPKTGTLIHKKKIVKSKAMLNMSLFDMLQAAAIMIQKNIRGYLCRQRLGRFLQSVLESAHSEGILGERSSSGNVTPLTSHGIPIKAIDSEDSQDSSLVVNHQQKNPFEDRSLKDLGKWQRRPIEMKTEYRDSASSHGESVTRTRTVKRPTKKIDVGIQADNLIEAYYPNIEHIHRSSEDEIVKEIKSEILIPSNSNKKVVAVGTQVSFRAIDSTPFNYSSLFEGVPMSMKESYGQKVDKNSGREKLEIFAKEEFKKWGQVDHLLNRLNQRLGKNSSKDVKDLFGRIEELANQSKYSIKNKFNINESQHSLLSLSKTPTIKSLQQETDKISNSQLIPEISYKPPNKTLSRGNSPIEIPNLQKQQQRAVEKWPDVVDIHKSANFSEGRLSENPLFESIDEKLDRVIKKEQRRKSSSMKWSGRCDVELSESVLRSVASDKEISLIVEQNSKLPSHRTLERAQSKDSFVGPVPNALAVMISGSDVYFSSGNRPKFSTPIPTENSEMSPKNESLNQLPILIKSRSKKSMIDMKPIEKAKSPTEFISITSYLETCEPHIFERQKTQQSLDEINIALQTILDDLGGDPFPPDDLLDASTKRLEGSHMWNIDSPVTSARKKASDHTLTLLSDLVLQHLIQEAATDRVWNPRIAGLRKKKSESNQESLADKFKKIDDLLNYDDKPVQTTKTPPAEATKTPPKQDAPKKFNGYPESILDDNIEEDVEKSEDAQSEAETVYGIRTNFNAVNEYLNLLLKFLRERLPELKLPPTKHSKNLILQRIHNLEIELKENSERNVAVKSITIPKRPGKKDRSSVNCFARTESPQLPLPAHYFTTLEEDILVGLANGVVVQGHEHNGRAVRHAAGVPPGDLRLLLGRPLGDAAVDAHVAARRPPQTAAAPRRARLAREGQGVGPRLRDHPGRHHPRQGRLHDGQHSLHGRRLRAAAPRRPHVPHDHPRRKTP